MTAYEPDDPETAARDHALRKCPACGRLSGVPILYGYPSPQMWDAADANRAVLGGCCMPMPGEGPNRYCTACDHRWCDDEEPDERGDLG